MASRKVDAVVAADGNGDFTTINAAIAAAPLKSSRPHTIHVRAGVYEEIVIVGEDKLNIAIVGNGMDKTVIAGSRCCADHYETPDTAIFRVYGSGFLAMDLAVENRVGPKMQNGQAVALLCEADRCVFYRCSLKSYQDTVYAWLGNQFYRECKVSGTVDFIFGDASAVFQNCDILARLPLPKQTNTITAQGRLKASDTGFVFHNCTVAADEDLSHAQATVDTYLGRPWHPFSRVIFMQSTLSGVVHPQGWLPWEKETVPDTIFYAEYSNNDAGADVSRRVNWPGCHVLRDPAEASAFTVENFINGNGWLPSTGVPFTPGL